MKHLFTIVFSFLLFNFGVGQTDNKDKIVAFHPSIGNTLDKSEKIRYTVFPEYKDSLFESAQLIQHDSSSYSVLIKTTNAHSFKKEINRTELDIIYAKIESMQSTNSGSTDDYVDNSTTQKKEKKQDHADTARLAGEITLQIVFIALQILAYMY